MTKESKMTNEWQMRWSAPFLWFRHHLVISASSLVIAAAVLLSLAPFSSKAADTNSVLDSWFAAQQKVQTWSADFIQVRQFRALARPLTNSGRIYFSAPNDFRWELGYPVQTIALRHGDELFLVYPGLKRAERYSVGADAPRQFRDTMSLLQAGMPRSRKEFEAQFQLLSLAETNGLWQMRLQPRSPGARQMLPGLGIGIRTNDFSLANTTLMTADGSTIESDYSNGVANPSLDKALFEWEPPADFNVIRQ